MNNIECLMETYNISKLSKEGGITLSTKVASP